MSTFSRTRFFGTAPANGSTAAGSLDGSILAEWPPAGQAATMVEAASVTKRFGRFTALDGVSFHVREGETLALLGPNGSGKTTMLRCLVGLAQPTAGEIMVRGLSVRRKPMEARRLMSYLPHRVGFDDSLTAREVLRFYCRLRHLPRERVDEVLASERFRFDVFGNKPVGQFSGGMLQRLGLAVACLPDAPILVLDEPTASLDPECAIRFRDLVASLKRDGKTILFSSHTLADVELLADRVAILVGGRLVAVESIGTLRDSLRRSSRMRVILQGSRLDGAKAAREAGADEATVEEDAVVVACRPEKRYRVLQAMGSAGGGVAHFSTEDVSLEDIYLQYIRENGDDKTPRSA